MTIKVKFFALARDLAGTGEAELSFDGLVTTDDALAKIVSIYPAISSLRPKLAIAVNQTYVRQNHALNDGDELALIPPVSGG